MKNLNVIKYMKLIFITDPRYNVTKLCVKKNSL